jgi:hypothetical protein
MTKSALLKKLDAALTAAEEEQMWGNLEIEIRNGLPTVLRKLTTERLRETTHYDRNNSSRYDNR